MPLSADLLDKVGFHLERSVSVQDLVRFDWRRQTDTVQLAFVCARLFADLWTPPGKPPRVVFVDGRISRRMMAGAYQGGDVKGYFNRRCHDEGVKGRRVLIYDTVSTKKMGRKESSKANLHFHGIFELLPGWTRTDLLAKLEAVFGRAERMDPMTGSRIRLGKHQFLATEPDWSREQHCSHNGVQVSGPLGKVMYAIKHAGSAYRSLELNDEGKRSRRAPAGRGACNKTASRLAKGIPSNFNRKIVFYDMVSRRAGKEAFEAWLFAKRAARKLAGSSKPVDLGLRSSA